MKITTLVTCQKCGVRWNKDDLEVSTICPRCEATKATNKPLPNPSICYECASKYVTDVIEYTHQPQTNNCFKCGKEVFTDRVFIGDNAKYPMPKDLSLKEYLGQFTGKMNVDELRIFRSIINGKLSRRTITKEQQDKMQAARKKAPTTKS